MSLISLFKRKDKQASSLTEEQASRLSSLIAMHAIKDFPTDWRQQAWVSTDLETSGLDVKHDRVLSIGSVAGVGGRVSPDASFEAILRQEEASSHSNILIHGISGTQQENGEDPIEALLNFLAFSQSKFHLGFHAEFDRLMLQNACKRILGIQLDQVWLDLAWLAPAVYPEHAKHCKSLDDWLTVFGIDVFVRHHAIADAWATSLLWLALQPRLPADCLTGNDVLQLANKQRALARYYMS
ncbi:3'-5' exonuclease [Leeia sp. TBRC 13508]|uniref:3'-5' exonuclease n=1 Tax=Leeia speluncae TaxID=2884804 RepID=A0ABS8D192_9NEIS|nr:3'-5' exonuclease [Leeia speluncae]MCB6181955.1 3'-5' exonuclease [Leeia speluncae]